MRQHFWSRIVTGVVVLVPIAITFLILQFVFRQLAGILEPLVRRATDLPDALIAAISIASLVVLLYVVGSLARLITAWRIVSLGDAVISRVPLAGTVYSASKQVLSMLAGSGGSGFKRVVWVAFPSPGLRALGFVTASVAGPDGTELLALFIPTAPNPTSGFVALMRSDQAVDAGITVEEAIKAIVSGGMLIPTHIAFPADAGNGAGGIPPTASASA